MDQMRMDPKHQFAAQYVLSRAANERREREALLAAAAMNMSHFAMQPLLGSGGTGGAGASGAVNCSPSGNAIYRIAIGKAFPLFKQVDLVINVEIW
jgi:hypothetical protein